MKFIAIENSKGGAKLINLERVTTTHYRSARENEGDAASLNIAVADTEN